MSMRIAVKSVSICLNYIKKQYYMLTKLASDIVIFIWILNSYEKVLKIILCILMLI
jgi:hypothetical protein